MKTSLQEIANQLHISRITVSKVLNGKPGVAVETKKKVVRKLIENGYKIIDSELIKLVQPPEAPEKKCIAVVATAPEFSEYWVSIIKSITDTASRLKYNCIYCFLSKTDTISSLPQLIHSKSVDGIVAINVYDEKVTLTLLDSGIPTVFFDVYPELFGRNITGDLILLEGRRTVAEITGRIIERGRTSVGFIGDITYAKTILDRWEGYRDAMRAHGLTAEPSVCLTQSESRYYDIAEIEKQIGALKKLPEAFVCANDSIAFMLADILKRRGCRIPEDIALSGFDDIRRSPSETSILTTASVDINLLGRRLIRQLLMRMETPEMSYETVYIRPKIVYRKSTDF